MNKVTKQDEGSRAIVPADQSIPFDQRLTLIREALTNPDVQPEKAVAMFDLMTRMEDRDHHRAFIEAKVAAIAAMPRIGKDGENTHTKTRYAKWETMQPIITPILTAHGLALNFSIGDRDGKVAVTPILSGHGYEEKGEAMVLPADIGKGRNDVQAVASSASYAKRHAAMAILNIVQGGIVEDDDGNAAGGTALDAYAQLDAGHRQLVDEGRSKAGEGADAYEEWFKTLDTGQRGFLAFNTAWPNNITWHGQNKDLAAKVG